jgi:hypothetical protein
MTPADSPRPPTTPHTEAGRDLLTVHGWIFDPGHLERYILAIEREAAAGALPSVERMTEAVRAVVPFPNTWRSTDDAARRYAEMILARLAAAPPEASER